MGYVGFLRDINLSSIAGNFDEFDKENLLIFKSDSCVKVLM